MIPSPYRKEVPAQTVDPWVVAWAELRRRRRSFSISVALLAAMIAAAQMRHLNVWWECLLQGLITVLFAVRCERFRCPRCANLFGRKGAFHNEFARHCLHCGLEIDTPQRT